MRRLDHSFGYMISPCEEECCDVPESADICHSPLPVMSSTQKLWERITGRTEREVEIRCVRGFVMEKLKSQCV